MHFYSYDGCDSDSHGSDPLSCSESETSGVESRRSLIIFLDDDDDEDEVEEPVHPLPSHRPKKPLPKNFGRNYHSPVKEETAQRMKTPLPEVYHTINCAPELRNKSLEELRVECYQQSQVATREPPKPVDNGMGGIPPSFFPWRDTGGSLNYPAGQVELSIQDVSMDVDD